MLQPLLHNLALLVALLVAWQVLLRQRHQPGPVGAPALLAGFFFGLAGVAVMMAPVRFADGVIYDGRSIVLGLAGLFGGPLAALVAALFCGTYRLYVGGNGAMVGTGVVIVSAALGVLQHYLRRRDERWVSWPALLGFGLLSAAAMLAFQSLLPGGMGWQVWTRIGPSILLFYPIAFFLAAEAFLDSERRHQVRVKLARSEEHHRRVLEAAPLAIAILDGAQRVLFLNSAFTGLFGYTLEDIPDIGTWWLKAYPDKAQRQRIRLDWEAEVARAAQTASRARLDECPVTCKDGSIRIVEVVGVSVADQFVARFVDLTDRIRMQQALRDSERIHRRLAENMQDLVWTLDAETLRFVYLSPSIARLLGITVDEALARPTACEAFGPEMQQKAHQAIRDRAQRFREGQFGPEHSFLDIIPQYRADGSLIWTEVTSRLDLDPDTGHVLVHGVTRDITDRKRAEDELRKNLEILDSVGDLARVGGWELDIATGKASWTRATKKLHGVPEDYEPVLEEALAFYNPEDHPGLAQAIRLASEQGIPYDSEWRLQPRGGEQIWVRTVGRPIYEGGKVVRLIGAIQDITQIKRAERRLAELLSDLQLDQRHARIGNWSFDPETGDGVFQFEILDQLLGRDPAGPSLTPREFEQLLDPGEVVLAREAFERATREGVPFETTLRLLPPSGQHLWVHVIGQPTHPAGPAGHFVRGTIQDFTDVMQAEEQLRLQALALDQVQDVVTVTSMDGRLQYVNGAACRLFGQPREKLVGQSPAIFRASPADARLHHDIIARTLEHGSWQGDVLNRRADGAPIVMELRTSIVHDARGDAIGVVGISTDVTERRQALDALRESEEKFRGLLERLDTIPVQGYDEERRVIYWNAASARVYGYTEQEAIGRPLEDLIIPPEMRDEAARVIKAWIEGGAPIPPGELVLHDKQGQPVHVYSTHLLHETSSGEKQLFCVDVDLGPLRQAQDEARRLAAAVEQAAEVVLITGCDGAIQYANPALEVVSGWRPIEVLGQNPRIFKSGEHPPEFYEELWGTILSGRVWKGRMRNKRKDGRLYTEEATISPMRDSTGALVSFVAIKADISKSLALEAEARQSQKMEALGQLTGGVAHDFNNLLQIINGYAEVVADEIEEEHPARAGLAEIAAAGQKAARLVSQLLLFSRRQIMQPIDDDLNAIVGGLLKMLRRVIGEHIHLDWRPCEEPLPLHADRNMVEQALLNLVVNARDAMPSGGKLQIATSSRLVSAADARLEIDAREGRFAVLAVRDNGCGIPHAAQSHIFEPFYTTKGVGKGTGLGLATVHGVAAQHKGWVRFESVEGRGSLFEFLLPLRDSDPAIPAALVSETALETGNETLLLAEDNEDVRRFAQRVLETAGYRLLLARDGQEAIDLFQQHAAEIDLLVLDVVMPRVGGREAYDRICALRPGVRALFCSGYSEDALHTDFVLDPGVCLVPKPFNRKDLLSAVRACLDGAPAG